MSIQAFALLPPDQQKAIMQQVLDHGDAVLNEAYSTLNPALLPQILTGPALQVDQQQLKGLIQRNQPETSTGTGQVLHVIASAQFGFISVDYQGTETDYLLDPKTHQPVGTPTTVGPGRQSLTIVDEDGVWKVKEIIQEQHTQ